MVKTIEMSKGMIKSEVYFKKNIIINKVAQKRRI